MLFTHKEQLRRSLLCVCLEQKPQEQPPRSLGDALAQEIESLQSAVLPLLKGCSQAEITAMRESLRRRADACSGGTTAASTPPPPLSAGIAGVPILALVYLRDEERGGNQKSNKIVYELRRKLLAYGGGCVGAVSAKATGTGRGGLPAPDALLGDWDPAAALDPGALGLLTKERLGHSRVARPLSAQAFLELNSNRSGADDDVHAGKTAQVA
eukprot:g2649.t1